MKLGMNGLVRPGVWILMLFGASLAACAGPSLVVVGDPILPAPEIPQLEVAVLDETGVPLPGVIVDYSGTTVPTNHEGSAFSAWPDRAVTVSLSAPGFHPVTEVVAHLPTERRIELNLVPVILTGTVSNARGTPLPDANVVLRGVSVRSDQRGRFVIERADPGLVQVERPGYMPAEVAWKGDSDVVALALEPRLIRSVRSTGPGTGAEEWDEMLALVSATELNAIVVDAKDEGGQVFYGTNNEDAYLAGAVGSTFDVAAAIADLQASDIYAITRIVTFKDDKYARAFPEIAVQATTGGVWEDSGGQAWLDPSNEDAWTYPLDLATELCEAGFDEIQFDYVRFPTDGDLESAVFSTGYDENHRVGMIAGFLQEARTILNPLGCAVAADIFSVVLSTPDDQGLGQRIEELSWSVDVLSPMVYASHYDSGWFGYRCPNEFPGQVVAFALDDVADRLDGPAILRPWLEDFGFLSGPLRREGCTSTHSPATVRAQIDAAESRADGWILWNASGNYSESAFEPAESE
ncbi:MAG: hypothetical protein HKO10_05225 [Acidimicrobiia bacterium]|nr:hypothetical protein [Acidimicrobiia bacterium]